MNRTMLPTFSRCLALFCASLLLVSTARAEFIGSAVKITFLTGSSIGSFDVPVPSDADPLFWELDGPVDIVGGDSSLLATIDSLSLELDGDPAVSLNFSITANAAPTAIIVTSSIVSFLPLINTDTFATAALTVTDLNGDGASATGIFAGKSYQALYNGSTLYANLVGPVVAAPDSSNTGSERFPLSGTVGIPGVVSSIQSQFGFVLSAFDSASGTSRFNVAPGQVVPEPSSFVLAGLALLGVLAFRRRKK